LIQIHRKVRPNSSSGVQKPSWYRSIRC
jgi:hypothetical protein